VCRAHIDRNSPYGMKKEKGGGGRKKKKKKKKKKEMGGNIFLKHPAFLASVAIESRSVQLGGKRKRERKKKRKRKGGGRKSPPSFTPLFPTFPARLGGKMRKKRRKGEEEEKKGEEKEGRRGGKVRIYFSLHQFPICFRHAERSYELNGGGSGEGKKRRGGEKGPCAFSSAPYSLSSLNCRLRPGREKGKRKRKKKEKRETVNTFWGQVSRFGQHRSPARNRGGRREKQGKEKKKGGKGKEKRNDRYSPVLSSSFISFLLRSQLWCNARREEGKGRGGKKKKKKGGRGKKGKDRAVVNFNWLPFT